MWTWSWECKKRFNLKGQTSAWHGLEWSDLNTPGYISIYYGDRIAHGNIECPFSGPTKQYFYVITIFRISCELIWTLLKSRPRQGSVTPLIYAQTSVVPFSKLESLPQNFIWYKSFPHPLPKTYVKSRTLPLLETHLSHLIKWHVVAVAIFDPLHIHTLYEANMALKPHLLVSFCPQRFILEDYILFGSCQLLLFRIWLDICRGLNLRRHLHHGNINKIAPRKEKPPAKHMSILSRGGRTDPAGTGSHQFRPDSARQSDRT